MEIIPFIIAMVLILLGTVLGCMLLWKLATVIQRSIKKDKNNTGYEESFDRMARAFIQHKKDTERRLENIEAAISQDDVSPIEDPLEESSYEHIEIDGPRNKIKNNLDENRTGRKQKTK